MLRRQFKIKIILAIILGLVFFAAFSQDESGLNPQQQKATLLEGSKDKSLIVPAPSNAKKSESLESAINSSIQSELAAASPAIKKAELKMESTPSTNSTTAAMLNVSPSDLKSDKSLNNFSSFSYDTGDIDALYQKSLSTKGTKTLTLDDAIFLALRYNNSLLSEEFARVIDKFNLRLAENEFELQYALVGSLNTSRTKSLGTLSHAESYNLTPAVGIKNVNGGVLTFDMGNSIIGPKNFYNTQFAATLVQPLLRGFDSNVVLAGLRNSYDSELISRLSFKGSIISQVTTVITQYYAVINNEINLRIQYDALKRAEKTVEDTKKYIAVGQKPRMDLPQFELQVTQSRLSIVQQINTLAQSKQTLLLTIGMDPDLKITIPPKVPDTKFKLPDLTKSIKTALRNDPTYQGDLLQLLIDRRDLIVAMDNLKWQLVATARVTWGPGGGAGPPDNNFRGVLNGRNNSQNVGLALNVPINDLNTEQGILSARVKMKSDEIKALFDERTVVTNVKNDIHNLETDIEAVTQAKEELRLQQLNLNNANLQFKAGKISSLEVTQQQTALTSAEQQLLSAQITLINDVAGYFETLQLTLERRNIKVRY